MDSDFEFADMDMNSLDESLSKCKLSTDAKTQTDEVGIPCGDRCHTIFDREDVHFKRRGPILGNRAQFCAAFYHVHEWGNRRRSCLDENKCTIAIRAKEEEKWTVQPKTVVALAKFEVGGERKYEARYTNCCHGKKHAEEHFDFDLRSGNLNVEISNAAEGNSIKLITLYLTYQPCNKSTGETMGTHPDQSCCDILKKVYSEVLQPRNIRLCIKATHTYRLYQIPDREYSHEVRRKNAVVGIQQLIESGVNVSSMNEEDWTYLLGLTDTNITGCDNKRKALDETIKGIFSEIRTWNIE